MHNNSRTVLDTENFCQPNFKLTQFTNLHSAQTHFQSTAMNKSNCILIEDTESQSVECRRCCVLMTFRSILELILACYTFFQEKKIKFNCQANSSNYASFAFSPFSALLMIHVVKFYFKFWQNSKCTFTIIFFCHLFWGKSINYCMVIVEPEQEKSQCPEKSRSCKLWANAQISCWNDVLIFPFTCLWREK